MESSTLTSPPYAKPVLTINDNVRDVERILFPIVFVLAGIINVCVIVGLTKTKLNISTKMLMMYQTCNNILGLSTNGIYIPLVINNLGYPETLPSFWHNLPGAITLGCIFSGMAILLFISIQRVCFIYLPMWAREKFDAKRTGLGIGMCILFGFAWAIHSLFECCRFEYSLSLGKWFYSAEMALIQGKAVLTATATFPILTALNYVAAGMKLLMIRRKNRIAANGDISLVTNVHSNGVSITIPFAYQPKIHASVPQKEAAREHKILIQFAIISFVWAFYMTLFNIIQQIPKLRIQEIALMAECFRMLVYTIDPIVYLIVLKEIRQNLIKMVMRKFN